MPITPLVIVDDDGTGTTGTIVDAALIAQLETNIDAAIDGADATVRSVAKGGTGASTLTGVLKGNGTSPITASAQLAVADGGTGLSALGTALQVLRVNAGATALEYAAAAGGGFIPQITAVTGAQHNFDLENQFTLLFCTGAAPDFTGFLRDGVAPVDGDQVLIVCKGTTTKVRTQDAGSTDANKIICPSAAGQIVGLGGMMLCVYDGTTDRWREALLDPGAAITVAHSAGDYTASGSMTWTVDSGDLAVYTYRQLGTSLEISITVNTSTPGGTTSTALRAALPSGFTGATGDRYAICYAYNNSTNIVAYARANGTTYVGFFRLDAANWTLETNLTYVGFTGLIPIQ